MKAIQLLGDALIILDQTKLPLEISSRTVRTYEEVASAIRQMEVRGAPLIGAAAAYGYVLGALAYQGELAEFDSYMQQIQETLVQTRPTAINLFWALRRMEDCLRENMRLEDIAAIQTRLMAEADKIAAEDVQANYAIGEHGNEVIPKNANILTYCNTGNLATVEYGTALGVIRKAFSSGKTIHIFACETRPFLQGARLTAWELMEDQIPVTLIADNMAGFLMQKNKIDLVIVGADRIAANGDVANKIGTYSLAVLAQAHNVPFYVAAPTATIDLKLTGGQEIPIEERSAKEILEVFGVPVASPEVPVYNPAFDVTPAKYISGIITEKGIVTAPYAVNLLKVMVRS
ncbi:MAG: S-methyl-5-thioribose-1-phosphate isomerase [Peptococcaceae bacterium]|nr:S-methyl-5-thioribose-1-phosphate isomerase [Peptococcaceae bacterium]